MDHPVDLDFFGLRTVDGRATDDDHLLLEVFDQAAAVAIPTLRQRGNLAPVVGGGCVEISLYRVSWLS